MITQTQRNILSNVLGTRYSKRVLEYLNENNIFNKKGNSYSIAYISHVFTGRTEDIKIEEAILEVYKIVKSERKNFNVKKSSILNAKPEAGTSGS